MKKIALALSMLAILASFGACKPKQSAYRQAYEQAKERELANQGVVADEPSSTPLVSKPVTNVQVRQEKLSAYEGEDASLLNRYSVVIGSFRNSTNARSLKDRMSDEGYRPVLAENEQGMLRVIVASFATREEAASARDAIKERFAPAFQDAWLLERAY